MKQIINLEFLRSKIPEMLFYLYLCDFSSSSSGKNHISGGSHFELYNMAAPLRIGFGSRKICTEHIKTYQCTNFHAFVQICTFPHENPPNCLNYWHKAHCKVTPVQRTLGKFYRPASITKVIWTTIHGSEETLNQSAAQLRRFVTQGFPRS